MRMRALLHRWLICPVIGHRPLPFRRPAPFMVGFGECRCGQIVRINVLNQQWK